MAIRLFEFQSKRARASRAGSHQFPQGCSGGSENFADAAQRSLEAGFEVIEIHMAHGYLLHEFLSPLSNRRQDQHGGSFEARAQFPLKVVEEVSKVCPASLPVFVRISATDWADGGWDLPLSIQFSRRLKALGVDLINRSSGGLVPGVEIPVGPGYQTPFAAVVRREAGLARGAVGMITEAQQAEQIISSGEADAVFLARAMLRDSYWPLHAAKALGVNVPCPLKYGRAKD